MNYFQKLLSTLQKTFMPQRRAKRRGMQRPPRLEPLEARVLLVGEFTDLGNLGLNAVAEGALEWGDYDSDGDLDVFVSGSSTAEIYRNEGDGTFTDINAGVEIGDHTTAAWGDYDNDGNLDLLVTGRSNDYGFTKIYRNDGSSSFTDIQADIANVAYGTAAWGDYDRDGDLDVLVTGADVNDDAFTAVYRNDGNGDFTDINAGVEAVKDSSAAWGDYDSDGNLDIVVAGIDGSSDKVTKIYHNNGDGTFTDINPGLEGVSRPNLAWGDYDSDGDLDLALKGYDNNGAPLTRIYSNDGSGIFSDTFAGIDGVGVGSLAWGDYDNDGLLDLVVSGYSGAGPMAKVYHNNGDGTFTDINTGLVNTDWGVVAWGDYDNDGDLDLLLAGNVGGQTETHLYRNESSTPNTAPSAPTGLTASVASTTSLTFSWTAATDTETHSNGLSYNLRVGTTPGGSDVFSTMADTTNGVRTVAETGPIQGTSYTLAGLTPGVTYYWSVQAVDTSFAGGAFATEESRTLPQFSDLGNLGIAGVYVSRVAWGDYDSDGDLDAVIQGSTGASDITRIYQNDGNGAFTDINAGLLGLGNGAVAWGDYDNDGQLDLIMTGQTSAVTSFTKLYHNDGSNTFTENTDAVFPGVKRSSVAWGDYDNDGDLDLLLSGNTNSGYVTSVHRNEGDGTFTDINAGLTQVAYGSVAWGDYDSDGLLDIVATGRTTSDPYSTTIYRNEGEGNFTDINAGLSTTRIRNVAWGDYDNDGDLDLVTSGFNVVTTGDYSSGYTNTVHGSTTVYRNDSSNTFTDIALGIPGTSYGSVAWGDYDNDGQLDLLVVGNIYGGETAKVYRNNGNDTFTDADAGLTIPYLGSGAWGDFDGDNDLDILIIGRDGSPFAEVYRNNETTVNTAPDAPTGLTATGASTTSMTFSWTAATDDETGSDGLSYNLRVGTTPGGSDVFTTMADTTTGLRTLASAGPIQGTSYTLTGLTAGVTYYWSVQAVDTALVGSAFATETSQNLVPPVFTDQGSSGINGVASGAVSWGDFDNDGDLDALVIGVDGSYTAVANIYENNGNGTFTDINAGLTGVYFGAAAWGDYDNDGNLDLLITGEDSDYELTSKLYHNNGNGTFTEINDGFVDLMSGAVAWGDYDNDGQLDVFISGLDDNVDPIAKLYHNNGNGTFTDTNTDLAGMTFGAAAWADYDNDGKLDLTYTGIMSSGFTMAIYHNDGEGVFTDIQASIGGVYHSSMAWGDYDNDGDLDLAIQGERYGHSRARIYRNDGDGDFTNINAGLTASAYGSVAWGDYDNDGSLDLLLTGFDGAYAFAKVYHNDGSDTFTDINAGLAEADYSSAAWGDYDNDGDLDMLLVGLIDATTTPFVKVYRNNIATANTAPDAPATLAVTTVSPTAGTLVINRDAQAGSASFISIQGTSQLMFMDARATTTTGNPATLGGQVSVMLVNTGANLVATTVAGVTVDGSGNYTVTINLSDNGTSSTATRSDIQAAIAAHAGAAALITALATAVGGYGTAVAPDTYGPASLGNLNRQLTGGQDTGDNDLTFTDVRAIADRDDYSVAVTFIATAANQSLGISVDTDTFGNNTINFTLATDATGRVTTTAAQLKTFLDNDASVGALTARTLVSATASGNGSGALAAASETSLPTVTNGGSAMTLSWAAATDTETASAGLSYNLRVGTTPGGSDVFSTMADSTSGLRTIATAGPIQGTSFALTNLTPGTTYFWSVQAIDSALAGGAFAAEQSFYVNVAPVVTPQDFLIGENSVNGAFIGTMAVTDADAGQTQTWSITAGNTNNAFAINPTTGVLTVNNTAVLDYEARTQISLTITVTDNGSPALSDSTVTTVFLRNENDAPVVTPKQFLIGENSVNNAYIGVVPVSDQDSGQTHTYSIVAGNTNNAFSINPTTGVLSVNNSVALDYETMPRFDLVVRVVDNGIPAAAGAATVTVFLRDTNDAPVVKATQFLIGENSVNNAFIGTVVATDQDAGQTKTYSIVAGNVGNAFAINPTTGVLTVNNSAALDYEKMPQFDLVVRVVDNGSPAQTGSAAVTVFLRDVNDAPVVTPKQFLISENSANGAFIGTIPATDQDAGQTRTFAITGGNTNNAFAIHPTTGVLSVNNPAALNYEANTQFNLTVTVTDNGSPTQVGSAAVTVFLRDVNDAPVVTPTQFLMGENSVNGAYIGLVPATDQDVGQTLTYSIVGGNTNNAFAINAATGVLSVNNSAALVYGTTPHFNLTVRVTDNGNPSQFGDAAVTVFLREALQARPAAILEEDTTTIVLPTAKRSIASTSARQVRTPVIRPAG